MLNEPWNERARRASPGGFSAQSKLAIALGLVVFIVLLPRRPDPLYALPAAIVAAGVVWCRLPLACLFRRLLIAEFFILGIAILSLVSPATRPVFLAVLLKSNLCVAAMLLLTWTTPFHEILGVLRRLGLPAVMLSTLALMSRYLPVLAEEARRMERARASRTFRRKRRILWQSLAAIIGQLFIRSADRAERIYLAMCARGWK
jgi:cobalt/nickel transport system permease protein